MMLASRISLLGITLSALSCSAPRQNSEAMAYTDLTRLSYHDQLSTMRITAFYLSVGLEWMFDFGLFLSVSGSYLRSMDVEVAYELEDARAGALELSHYGVLDLGNNNSFQALRPGLTVGYAF